MASAAKPKMPALIMISMSVMPFGFRSREGYRARSALVANAGVPAN
jgi:hypothetical protein